MQLVSLLMMSSIFLSFGQSSVKSSKDIMYICKGDEGSITYPEGYKGSVEVKVPLIFKEEDSKYYFGTVRARIGNSRRSDKFVSGVINSEEMEIKIGHGHYWPSDNIFAYYNSESGYYEGTYGAYMWRNPPYSIRAEVICYKQED